MKAEDIHLQFMFGLIQSVKNHAGSISRTPSLLTFKAGSKATEH